MNIQSHINHGGAIAWEIKVLQQTKKKQLKKLQPLLVSPVKKRLQQKQQRRKNKKMRIHRDIYINGCAFSMLERTYDCNRRYVGGHVRNTSCRASSLFSISCIATICMSKLPMAVASAGPAQTSQEAIWLVNSFKYEA